MPEFADIDIVFDATSAGAHVKNDAALRAVLHMRRSEEHTSELQSQDRISYAVFCLKKKKKNKTRKNR